MREALASKKQGISMKRIVSLLTQLPVKLSNARKKRDRRAV
jgi:hypothetical protein